MFILWIIYLAVIVLVTVGTWKVYTKAGKPGWAVIIPIYNLIVLLEIAGKPIWWIVLFFIPIVSFIAYILLGIAVAEKFGKGTGFGVGLGLLGCVFFPILGFSDAQYLGAAPAAPPLPVQENAAPPSAD